MISLLNGFRLGGVNVSMALERFLRHGFADLGSFEFLGFLVSAR